MFRWVMQIMAVLEQLLAEFPATFHFDGKEKSDLAHRVFR